jgi:hypothetical protein
MVELKESSRLPRAVQQSAIVAGGYTLFRYASDGAGHEELMTATAGDPGRPAFPNPDRLMFVAAQCFAEIGMTNEKKQDFMGREYAQFYGDSPVEHIEAAITKTAQMLELERPISRNRSGKERDMSSLYEELSVEDGEPVYLSDGMYLHPDGSIR